MLRSIINPWIRSHATLVTFCGLFIGCFILFAGLKQQPVFFDGDPFYHAKITQLMIERHGIVKDFPWMPGSILDKSFIDHHLLYHALLVPFVLVIGDPLAAIRIASIFFAALCVAIFFLFIKSCSARLPLVFTLTLLTSQLFITRINLDKAPAISLIALIVWLYALTHKKNVLLFFTSFFYVWLYSAWPILIIASFLWCITDGITQNIGDCTHNSKNLLHPHLYSPLTICLCGLLVGIIINPYFPTNIFFYKTLYLSIALLTKGVTFGIGSEWLPISPVSIIQSNILFGVLFLCTLSWSVIQILHVCKKDFSQSPILTPSSLSHISLFFGAFSILLFFFTMKSQRMSEYFIPISTCFIALSLSDLIPSIASLKEVIKCMSPKHFVHIKIFVSMLCMVAVGYAIQTNLEGYQALYAYTTDHTSYSFHSMQRLSEYMKRTVPANSIVATNDWSYFSQLFYYASEYRYLWGLDPTLTHDADPKRYDTLFSLMSSNKNGESVSEILKKDFGASYLVIAKRDGAIQGSFSSAVAKNKTFKKLYEDEDSILYAIL